MSRFVIPSATSCSPSSLTASRSTSASSRSRGGASRCRCRAGARSLELRRDPSSPAPDAQLMTDLAGALLRAALAFAAPFFGAGETALLADGIEQPGHRVRLDDDAAAVQREPHDMSFS